MSPSAVRQLRGEVALCIPVLLSLGLALWLWEKKVGSHSDCEGPEPRMWWCRSLRREGHRLLKIVWPVHVSASGHFTSSRQAGD